MLPWGVTLRIHPTTAARFDDGAAILAPKKAGAQGCWCLSHRLSPADNDALKAPHRAEAMLRVRAGHTGKGVGHALLEGAVEHARTHRAKVVEAYLRAGFTVVGDTGYTVNGHARVIVRKTPCRQPADGWVMSIGTTQASNCSSVNWPERRAASRRVEPVLLASLAMAAAAS